MINLEDVAGGVINVLGVNVSPEAINSIAKKHAVLGAAAGAIPIPGASAVAVATNIWYMYKEINDTLGLKFGDNKLKTIISGIVANLGSTVLLTVGAGELLKFIPGVGSVTGATIEAAVNAAITYTAAFIYLKAISVLAFRNAETMSDDDLKNEIDLYMKNNKDEVKAVFSDARNTFKKDKSIVNNKNAAKALEEEMKAEQKAMKQSAPSDSVNIEQDIQTAIKGVNPTGEKKITCPECGNELSAKAKFCDQCGYRIPAEKVCPSCGEKLKENAKFCLNCGTKVE